MSTGQQPPRGPKDGQIQIWNDGPDGDMCILVEHSGETQRIVLTEYNAWRVFGTLALLLGVQLPKKIAESLKL